MEEKSKTERKKEAQALQELGEKLVKLSDDQVREIDLPAEICDAVTFARTIKSHGASKRQMQYIGTLMRKIDPAPVQEAIRNIETGNYKKAMAFKKIEAWRDGLIAGNKMLMGKILEECPDADRQQLSQLVRNAKKESEHNKPPGASRALFRYLREIVNPIKK
jgi:ribosome-associated protein